MQVAVMGAGAVGCYFGGVLARAGHAVTFIGRPAHVQAMQRDGLHLQTVSFDVHVPVQASTDTVAVSGAQLVLVCVKSTDTETAGEQMAAHLAPDALLMSLQNGVDNAERLQALLQREVLPAVVYVGAEMAGPGHVLHHGRGELVIGASAHAEALRSLFVAAGVPVQVSDNVAGALWSKLVINCVWNALSAITQLPYGRVAQGDGVPALTRELFDECAGVAQAVGVALPQALWAQVQAIAQTIPNQRSSTAQDLARGRRSEIDHLNGVVVRLGAWHGIATPVNRVLLSLVKLLEDRNGEPAAAAA